MMSLCAKITTYFFLGLHWWIFNLESFKLGRNTFKVCSNQAYKRRNYLEIYVNRNQERNNACLLAPHPMTIHPLPNPASFPFPPSVTVPAPVIG